MTFLKWTAIILVAGYVVGLVLLFVKQRTMLFPIRPLSAQRRSLRDFQKPKSAS